MSKALRFLESIQHIFKPPTKLKIAIFQKGDKLSKAQKKELKKWEKRKDNHKLMIISVREKTKGSHGIQ